MQDSKLQGIIPALEIADPFIDQGNRIVPDKGEVTRGGKFGTRNNQVSSGSSAGQIESAEDSNAIGSGWSKYSNFTRRTGFVPRARVGRQQLFPADSAKSPTDPTL